MANLLNKLSVKIKLDKIQDSISDFASALLLTIILLVPFVVLNYGKRYYIDGKVVLLYASSAVLFLLILLSNRVFIKIETKISLIFLTTICISTTFSDFSNTALYGNVERREGCIMFFVYIILFIAASSFFSVDKKAIYAILSAGSIMSIYAVVEMYDIDPIQKHLFGSIVTHNTSIATIGNSNFLSSYLVMFLMLAVALYIYKNKYIYLVFSSIIFLGFLAARTRGGWLSFALVCFIGLIFIIKDKKKVLRAFIIVFTFTILTFGLNSCADNKIFARARINNIISKNKVEDVPIEKESLKNNALDSSNNASSDEANDSGVVDSNISEDSSKTKISSGSNKSQSSSIKLEGSAASRMNILKVTFKAFLQKPLLGEGPDTLGERLKKDFLEDYNSHAKAYNEGIDKAHNEYLEYATSGGIFTLLSYLVFVCMILFKLFKRRKEENNIIIFLMILVYLLQAFFNISVIMVAPLFWILLGYGLSKSYKEALNN